MVRRSTRIPENLAVNRLTLIRQRLGTIPYDLTVSNPSSCDLPYEEAMLTSLAHSRSLRYSPDPRGPRTAREAVAAWYESWGVQIVPEQVLLTASTSEAYSFLFRLLADPGDTVLVPSPSYPLFDALTRLDGLESATYSLTPEDDWRPDLLSIKAAPEATRALILVHPNNPTGSFIHPEDARSLVAMCRERDWALIADEVFLPYPLNGGPGADFSFSSTRDCLCFTLGGFSKAIGQPQLKLAWIVVNGPANEVKEAFAGLEYVADAFLSVSTPVALATPELLLRGRRLATAILERCAANLRTLDAACAQAAAIDLLQPGGGWSAVIRVPKVLEEEELAVELLENQGVAVHPGYFFDFPQDGILVLSLLPRPEVFCEGVRRMLEHIERSL